MHTVALSSGRIHLAVDEKAGRVLATTYGPAVPASFTLPDGSGLEELTPTGSGTLYILDTQRGTVLHTVQIGLATTALTVDTRQHRVFVTNAGAIDRMGAYRGPGTLSVIDEHSGRRLRMIGVGVDPVALALDGHSGQLFIASEGSIVPRSSTDSWNWMPAWLRSRLPFVLSQGPRPQPVPASVSMLNTAHL